MKGQDYLFKGTGVAVPQKVINEPRIFSVTFGSCTIGNSGGLNHPLVPSHIIHQPDKTFVQNRELFIQNRFCLRNYTMRHEPSK
jgi:hypothetical protein